MHLSRWSTVFVPFALCVAFNRRVAAQTRIEVGPVLGYYSPAPLKDTDGPNAPGRFASRAYGGEAALWFFPHVGLRAEYLTATKRRNDVPNPGGYQPGLSGRIAVGDLLATYGILNNNPEWLWLAAGPGYIHHDGDAFHQSGDPTDLAAVLCAGSTQTIAGALRLTLGVSAFVYRYGGVFGPVGGPPIGVPPNPYGRRMQHDLMLHAALAWTLGGP